MIKGLIFDLDGTILDSIEDIADACNKTLELFGFPLRTTEEYIAMIGRGLGQLLRDSMPEGTPDDIWEKGYEYLSNWYKNNNMNKTKPYDGILEVFKCAKEKGLILAVLSNKPQELTEPMIKHYFCDCFDYIVGKREGVPRKPDPTSAKLLLAEMGLKKEEILYVGDTDIDMKTAKSAGFTAIGVTWGFRSEAVVTESGADFVVHNSSELKKVILNHL